MTAWARIAFMISNVNSGMMPGFLPGENPLVLKDEYSLQARYISKKRPFSGKEMKTWEFVSLLMVLVVLVV